MAQSLEDKTLPPPPPEGDLEVTIRTLASDLELLKKSGGTFSYARASEATVTLGHGGATVAGKAGGESATAERERESKRHFQTVVWAAVIVLGIAIFFWIGRSVVPRLLGGTPSTDTPQSGSLPAAAPAPRTGNSKTAEPTFLGHATLFEGTASVPVLDLDLYNEGVPPDRVSFMRNLRALADADQAVSLHEVVTHGIEGRPLAWGELVRLLGAEVLDYEVLINNFSRDYTMFVYRDGKGGIWPGFIFRLKQGVTPLMLQRDIFKIESSPQAWSALFAEGTGIPAPQFKDVQISGQPARSLVFQAPSGAFTYGWFFNAYLVMSTNDTGLRMAIERL